MLLAVLALVTGAAAGWLTGRRPPGRGRSAKGRPAGGWHAAGLIAVGAVLLGASRWVGGGAGVGVMAAGYAFLVAFAAANSRHPGMVLIAAGLLANLLVVLLNAGMPVRDMPAGVTLAGHHHGLSARDHLTGLADTVRISPLDETVSPGDIILAVGGCVAAFFWLEGPAAGPRLRGGRPGRDPGLSMRLAARVRAGLRARARARA